VRRRRWTPPSDPLPRRPYRDTALVFGGMAVAIVLVSWATGGDLIRAALIAAAFFVAATAWGWRSWRERLREKGASEAKGAGTPP
jgi:membrane protein implicated in regulation of membrane protease activity